MSNPHAFFRHESFPGLSTFSTFSNNYAFTQLESQVGRLRLAASCRNSRLGRLRLQEMSVNPTWRTGSSMPLGKETNALRTAHREFAKIFKKPNETEKLVQNCNGPTQRQSLALLHRDAIAKGVRDYKRAGSLNIA